MTGIDVSYAQGAIDWKKAKASGVEFAIIRTSWGTNPDKWGANNVAGARAAGLPIGIYHYCYAITPEAAKKEAAYLKLLAGQYAPDLGTWTDWEEPAQTALPAGEQMEIIRAFRAGCECGLYSFQANLEKLRAAHRAELDAMPLWVAQWAPACTYTGFYRLWQRSNKGSIDGITGDVDIDVLLAELEQENETEILKREIDALNLKCRMQADELGKYMDVVARVRDIVG